jgi:hypothetical protein
MTYNATTTDNTTTTATFVMPFYSDQPDAMTHALESVGSVVAQSDPDWRLVIVDDCSPVPARRRRQQLARLQALDPERILVVENPTNRGQGVCRNIGIDVAHRAGSPIVLFQDADDIAHPRRLEVTRAVMGSGEADFIYSPFTVIDEKGNEPGPGQITPSVAEILDALERGPAQGRDCWIPIATETGYLTLTSTVSVSTELARSHPFPDCRGSEDTHAFLRMSGGGGVFSYQPDIPAKYRVRTSGGSADRARIGRRAYYATKVRIDCDGFEKASRMALARGAVTRAQVAQLRAAFRSRLAETIRAEGFAELVSGAW